jgi:hypothetical protein
LEICCKTWKKKQKNQYIVTEIKKKKNHTKTVSKERKLLRPRERIAQESVRGSPWTGCGECGIGARGYCDEAGKKTQPSGGIKVAISEWQPPRSCHLAKINHHQYGYLWDVALFDWCTPMHFRKLFSSTCRHSRPAVRCPGAMSLKTVGTRHRVTRGSQIGPGDSPGRPSVTRPVSPLYYFAIMIITFFGFIVLEKNLQQV